MDDEAWKRSRKRGSIRPIRKAWVGEVRMDPEVDQGEWAGDRKLEKGWREGKCCSNRETSLFCPAQRELSDANERMGDASTSPADPEDTVDSVELVHVAG